MSLVPFQPDKQAVHIEKRKEHIRGTRATTWLFQANRHGAEYKELKSLDWLPILHVTLRWERPQRDLKTTTSSTRTVVSNNLENNGRTRGEQILFRILGPKNLDLRRFSQAHASKTLRSWRITIQIYSKSTKVSTESTKLKQ